MTDKVAGFVRQLERLTDKDRRDGPATLAHLRRGLTDPAHALSRAGWLFDGFDADADLDAALLVAGLFAHAKGDCDQVDNCDFGQAFARIGAGHERRMIDLLDTDRPDLPYKLRQAVTLLAREGIGLDWRRLYHDLRFWGDPKRDREVQKWWARGYWSAVAQEATSDNQPTPTET